MSNAKTTGGNMYDCESKLRKGPWTLEEDNLLMQYISCHGDGRWNSLALFAGLKRTGKSCRLRWLNYLKPDIKRGNLTSYEQLLILELHSKWGNRWSKIAQHLPGRTDNEIKNYWRTRVQKQARLLKVDSNSKKFLEAIRTFWVPRLVEQMEQNSPSTPSSSISTVETQTSKPTTTNPHPTTTIMVNNSDSNLLNSTVDNETQFEIPVEDDDYYNVGFMQEMEGQDGAIPDRHVAGTDWCGEDLWSNFWNTDELWQFRKWEDLAPC